MFTSLKRLFASTKKVEDFGGTDCQVTGLEYRPLYDCLSRLPGAVFPRKPRYLWTGLGVYTEFVLRGHAFQIKSDMFEAGLCISPKDELPHSEEIRDIREHIERFIADT